MQANGKPQHLAFVLVSIALVLCGIVFSRAAPDAGGEPGAEERSESSARLESFERQVEANTERLRTQVEGPARRFVDAYLLYEVGIVDAEVRAEIRASATTEFASVLLASIPRAPNPNDFPEPALLQSLEVSFESVDGDLAIAEGEAMRGQMPELFSFELEPVGGTWLVSGVAG